MRQLFIAAASAAVAIALASCDPKELVVTDTSELKSITVQVSNDTQKWEYGEERLFTIVPNPKTAICDRFDLQVSNPEIVQIRGGELPNQFKVTAEGEGKLIVTAVAVGHGEMPGQTGNDWTIERTATEEFTLVDSRVKPTRPVVNMSIAPGTDIKAKKVLAEDVAFVTDDALDLILNVSSDEARATYSVKADDGDILKLERTGAESWMLRTAKPGRTWLNLTVTTGAGNVFEYRYLVYVFGHLTMETQYCPLDGSAGFSVSEHSYSGLSAQVYIAGELFGWPWNDESNVESIALPTYSGTLDISEAFDHSELMDCSEQQDYLYGLSAGPSYNPAPFTPHKAKLNYIVTLSDPYIIIDTLLDDTNLEEPRWFNFRTEGALQQNGVAKVEQPDEILRFAQNDNEGGQSYDTGWRDGGEIVIPL